MIYLQRVKAHSHCPVQCLCTLSLLSVQCCSFSRVVYEASCAPRCLCTCTWVLNFCSVVQLSGKTPTHHNLPSGYGPCQALITYCSTAGWVCFPALDKPPAFQGKFNKWQEHALLSPAELSSTDEQRLHCHLQRPWPNAQSWMRKTVC